MDKKKAIIIGSIFLVVGIVYLVLFLALRVDNSSVEQNSFNYISDEQNQTLDINTDQSIESIENPLILIKDLNSMFTIFIWVTGAFLFIKTILNFRNIGDDF
jgi:hypothetical protein